jgi:hypothetical protein
MLSPNHNLYAKKYEGFHFLRYWAAEELRSCENAWEIDGRKVSSLEKLDNFQMLRAVKQSFKLIQKQ